MHGIHLQYSELPRVFESFPSIIVAPVIFLRSRYGSWLCVEAPPHDYVVPQSGDELAIHLREFKDVAEALLREVNQRLAMNLAPSAIASHYEDNDSFEGLRGVVETGRGRYLIATGDKTHYLMSAPSVQNCDFHDWAKSHMQGVAAGPSPIMRPTITPRSFFTSGAHHHCSHRDVSAAKSNPITAANRERCGLRSGNNGSAFCEIWRFDNHLCCRTCVFEDVCTKAEAFQLPCHRQPLVQIQVNS